MLDQKIEESLRARLKHTEKEFRASAKVATDMLALMLERGVRQPDFVYYNGFEWHHPNQIYTGGPARVHCGPGAILVTVANRPQGLRLDAVPSFKANLHALLDQCAADVKENLS